MEKIRIPRKLKKAIKKRIGPVDYLGLKLAQEVIQEMGGKAWGNYNKNGIMVDHFGRPANL